MDNSPLISVCMLCFNHEKYVEQAINSVINQTYDNWELIIVDNSSTDSSRQKIADCSFTDDRITFISLEYNSYPSGGINTALKQAKGDYISVLSADDYFMSDKLEKQLNYMKETNSCICFTWVKFVNDSGVELDNYKNHVFNKHFKNTDELMKMLFNGINVFCAVTPLISQKAHEKIGFYDNRLLQAQDFDLWLRALKEYDISILEEELSCYRIRDDGANLSIGVDTRALLRGNTEAIWYMQNIPKLETCVISKIIGNKSDEISKYKNLFYYYLKQSNKVGAAAMVFAAYDKLTESFSFPSELYQDFLEMYSRLDLFDELGFRKDAVAELCLEQSNSESSSIKKRVYVNKNIYSFDIYIENDISKIEYLPINQPCKINLKSARAIFEGGNVIALGVSKTNAEYFDGQYYDFKRYPKIIFDKLNVEAIGEKIQTIEIDIDILPYNKECLISLNEAINYLNDELNNELDTYKKEINKIYSSLGWKLTKPVRVITKLFNK
ncbi:glycosyltransferase family 2 protein [Francisella philomiragia]|uniref:Glycosyltransferase family 2 protein n=1 Tax=Francisella philomiragia TaxID=28110 RepID=A0ABS1G9C0_9GAMM|nr:glycosyltransferase family 2 protein [Francisella philomiragia]MBK2257737.1 glycosyltransferase family 2 protein [Francisella philomiragia]MBK2301425.1 glycosyltransferase family 2 protein [Francisella philomiragia]